MNHEAAANGVQRKMLRFDSLADIKYVAKNRLVSVVCEARNWTRERNKVRLSVDLLPQKTYAWTHTHENNFAANIKTNRVKFVLSIDDVRMICDIEIDRDFTHVKIDLSLKYNVE